MSTWRNLDSTAPVSHGNGVSTYCRLKDQCDGDEWYGNMQLCVCSQLYNGDSYETSAYWKYTYRLYNICTLTNTFKLIARIVNQYYHSSIDKDGLIASVTDVDAWWKYFLSNKVDRMVPGEAQHRCWWSTVQCGEGGCLQGGYVTILVICSGF